MLGNIFKIKDGIKMSEVKMFESYFTREGADPEDKDLLGFIVVDEEGTKVEIRNYAD
jgi:hypothetical protein